jgi:hypothetical protein
MNPLDFLLGKGKPTPGARPGWPPAPQGQFPSSWGAKKSSAPVRPPIGIKGAGRLLGPAFAIPDIIEQVNQIRNPQDNIITNLQNLGTGVGNLLQGKPYLSGARVGTPGQYYGPAYASEEALGIKSGGPRNYGPGYREDELRAGQQAEDFRPGAGFPNQQSAADRAYQQEKSRVAQLTAQDPELQRYEKARAVAKTQEEMNAARDIGMQIWQQKYSNTPMAQQGGAVGMFNPLMDRTFGYQSGSAPGQQMGAPTLGPSPLVPQIDQSLNPASPNFIGGEGRPLVNFADPSFENMTPEKFQELLNQYTKR